MRRLFTVVMMVLLAGNAFGFGIPSLGGFGDADTSGVMSRADALKDKVGTATVSLAEGLADVLEMSGKAEEAATLKASIASAVSDRSDFTKIQSLSNAIGVGQNTLAGVAISATIPLVAAQAKLPSAVFNLSSAIATDMAVAQETKDLAKDIPGIAAKVKNPLKLKDLTDALGAIRFVASQIIPQAQTAGGLVKELVDFASSNGIVLE